MPKFNRLPSLKRCNARGNFPFNYKKYHQQIYHDGLPGGYISLDYSLGDKIYKNMYAHLRRGRVRGIIYYNKNRQKWQYGIKAEDIRPRKTGIKDRCQEALAKIKDLDSEKYFTVWATAKLIGFNVRTLDAHIFYDNLRADIPATRDYKELSLHPNTKRIIKVEDLRTWLNLLASGRLVSRSLSRRYHSNSRSYDAKKEGQNRRYQKYQDRQQLAYGTYGDWRPKPNHSPESKARRAKRKREDVDNL